MKRVGKKAEVWMQKSKSKRLREKKSIIKYKDASFSALTIFLVRFSSEQEAVGSIVSTPFILFITLFYLYPLRKWSWKRSYLCEIYIKELISYTWRLFFPSKPQKPKEMKNNLELTSGVKRRHYINVFSIGSFY